VLGPCLPELWPPSSTLEHYSTACTFRTLSRGVRCLDVGHPLATPCRQHSRLAWQQVMLQHCYLYPGFASAFINVMRGFSVGGGNSSIIEPNSNYSLYILWPVWDELVAAAGKLLLLLLGAGPGNQHGRLSGHQPRPHDPLTTHATYVRIPVARHPQARAPPPRWRLRLVCCLLMLFRSTVHTVSRHAVLGDMTEMLFLPRGWLGGTWIPGW
jgi:hypothetical protein